MFLLRGRAGEYGGIWPLVTLKVIDQFYNKNYDYRMILSSFFIIPSGWQYTHVC